MELIIKEIHAYKNNDGTYHLECIADTYVDGELMEVKVIYERANLTIDALANPLLGTICELVVEENENENT